MTPEERLETATDLRSAAELVHRHGHTTGEPLEHTTGRLCALGAILFAAEDLEVVSKLNFYRGQLEKVFSGVDTSGGRLHGLELDGLVYRRDGDLAGTRFGRARAAFAEAVPACRCVPNKQDYGTAVATYHYNDRHCTGGSDLANLLIETAEKLEADERIF